MPYDRGRNKISQIPLTGADTSYPVSFPEQIGRVVRASIWHMVKHPRDCQTQLQTYRPCRPENVLELVHCTKY